MKYRTKLYLVMAATATASTLLALAAMYKEVRLQFFDQLRSRVVSIAATTAAFANGELLKQIRTRADEGSLPYIAFRDTLRKVRDANRRSGNDIRFIYTLSPSPTNPQLLVYGVDAADNPKDMSHVGDPWFAASFYGILDHLDIPYSPHQIISDQWGRWLSGFAPIRDANGNYIATVGVDIAAHDVTTIMEQLLLYELYALLGALILVFIFGSILSQRATKALRTLCRATKAIGAGNFQQQEIPKAGDEFDTLASSVNAMARGLQERERIKVNFATYVSRHVVEKILQSNNPLQFEGERRKITVLFTDIRDFTRLVEKMAPEEVVSLLNTYFAAMLAVVFKNEGTLDKFLGDGMMVEFGAPLVDEAQEMHALLTALQMQEELAILRQKWEAEGKPPIEMSIGIHTGIAIVGNIGSIKKMEYTAIGDTVNVAARLQAAAKMLKSPVLVSETTMRAVEGYFSAQNLGPLTLPGHDQPIHVYSVSHEVPH